MNLAVAHNNQNFNRTDKRKVKVEKNGNVYSISDKKTSGKQKGDKAFPFKTLEEVRTVIEYYENKANDENTKAGYRQLADRNKLLLILGFNVGIRASDLRKVKWCNIYDSNGNFLEPDNEETDTRRTSTIVEQKTQKIKNLIFNDMVRNAFEEYVEKYDIDKTSDDYVFFNRQKTGDPYITREQVANIVKEAAKSCGIKRRVASHSLRKTYCHFQMMAHQDDAMFISEMMDLLNHDSEASTLKYVGLDVERKVQYHNDVQLGKVSVLRNHKKIEVNHDKEIVIDKTDMEFILKQLAEKCYTCNNECGTCYNSMLAKKYGFDLNTI